MKQNLLLIVALLLTSHLASAQENENSRASSNDVEKSTSVDAVLSLQKQYIESKNHGSGSGGLAGGYNNNSASRARTEEEIRNLFKQNSEEIYHAYKKALSTDPSLQGTIKLKLIIEDNGVVSECLVITSGLKNKSLEDEIANIVSGFKFTPGNFKKWKGAFPITLLPN